jgi:chromate transporter
MVVEAAMNGRFLGQLAIIFGSLSLISIGGANVLIPEIHRQVVETHAWLDSATFTRLFAISQAAPGPNVMLASIIGWHVAGLPGLAVATVAILAPPAVIALFAGRGLRQWSDSRAVRVLTTGLVPLALGLMLASGIVAARAASGGIAGYAITGAIALAVFFTKRNPLIWMGLGMIVFVLLQPH